MKKITLLVVLLGSSAPSLLLAFGGAGPWANGAYYPGQLDGRYFGNVYNNVDGTFSSQLTSTAFFTTNINVTTVVSNIGGLPVTNIVTSNTVTGPNFQTSFKTKGSVISGVMGFAIRGGAPAVSGGGSTGASTAGGGASASGASPSGGSSLSVASGSSGAADSIALDSSINYFAIYVNGSVFIGRTAAGINLDTQRVAGIFVNGVGDLAYQRVTNISVTTNTGSLSNSLLGVPTATAGGYFNAKIKNNKSPFVFKGTGAITVSSTNLIDALGTHSFNTDGIKSSDLTSSGSTQ